jgi:hypothetical protein
MQPYIERRKSIFYDTDNIAETQTEVLRVCDCPGVFRIDSRASNGYYALCIHIPAGRATGAECRGWNGSPAAGITMPCISRTWTVIYIG